MPTPKQGESEEKFMSRCIKTVMNEGANKDQAIGKCIGLWTEAHNTIRRPFKIKKLKISPNKWRSRQLT